MIKRARTQKRRPEAVQYRTNRQIRVREVRLIDHNGENRGVIPTSEALDIARMAELDLVEVAPNARPPVCRVMDYNKFAYEQQKKQREARKRQTTVETKTIRIKVKTSDFHQSISTRKARGWLEEGKKVRVSLRFYAREHHYPQIAIDKMMGIAKELEDISTIEQHPTMEGRSMTMMLTPSNEGS